MTQDDIGKIQYFIEEKGDIERWSSYEENKELIVKELPELTKCLRKIAKWQTKLQEALDCLDNYSTEEEPETSPHSTPDDVVIKVNGKYHYCEQCRVCNVFKKLDPDNPEVYTCNHCQTECVGE